MRPIKKSVDLPLDLWQEIEKACEKEDRNFSQLVRCALRAHLDQEITSNTKTARIIDWEDVK